MKFKVACIQNCADDDLAENITMATELVRAAREAGADLICLPENFSLIQVNDARLLAQAHTEESHPAIPHFSGFGARARRLDLDGFLGDQSYPQGRSTTARICSMIAGMSSPHTISSISSM